MSEDVKEDQTNVLFGELSVFSSEERGIEWIRPPSSMFLKSETCRCQRICTGTPVEELCPKLFKENNIILPWLCSVFLCVVSQKVHIVTDGFQITTM